MPTTKPRQRNEYETTEYAAMLGRMVKSLGKRLADGDPSDIADALELQRQLEETIAASVQHMVRVNGFSWAQIGDELGMSRQGAYQRFGRRAAGGK